MRGSILAEISRRVRMEIDIGIESLVVFQAGRTYFENTRGNAGSILQVMSIGIAGKKTRALSGAKNLLAAFGDQHDLSLQDIHELLRPGMPVPLARPGARLKFKKVDADVPEPCRDGQPVPNLVLAGCSEWLRIARAGQNWRLRDIDFLRHPDLASNTGCRVS